MKPDRDRRRDFESAFPAGTYIDPNDVSAIEAYVRKRAFLRPGASLRSAARAGEGNMNLTLRIVTSEGSFILKQARPWVEKYPQIDAPAERALVEIAFYETIAGREPLRRAMPSLLGQDASSGVLFLEHLGEASDFTGLYRGLAIAETHLLALVDYLAELHRPFPSPAPVFRNRAMRALNHEHIFRLPLARNGTLDLDAITPGLADEAARLRDDSRYVATVTALGETYLRDGPVLVHGDYFPGSWLESAQGVRVIDPEFCFLGDPAFDVGVMLGHLHLARQSADRRRALHERYRERTGADKKSLARARQFAGVEIMRRLIGVAQLPLEASLDEKRALLAESRQLVLSPEGE